MNRIAALILAGSLLLTAATPVAAINDGTSNTRGRVAGGCATAGHHGTAARTETRASGKVFAVPSGGFPAAPAH